MAANVDALKLSESSFRLMIEAGNDIICIISDTGLIRFASSSVEPLLNFTPDEMMDKNFSDLIHSDDQAKIAMLLSSTLSSSESGKLTKFELRINHKDSSYRYVEFTSRNLLMNTFIGGILLIGRDITERRVLEMECAHSKGELEAERYKFREIIDHAPMGVWLLGVDGKIKFINKAFCNAVGITEQQFQSAKHYSDVLPPNISASCMKSDRECLQQDSPHISREWLPMVGGKEDLIEITKIKLHDQGGEVIGLVGWTADATERKRTEERLRLTAKVFENAMEGIVVTDPLGNIIEVNEAFSKITGYSAKDIIGKNPRILQSGHQSPAFYKSMWESIINIGHWTGEVWNRRKDGESYAGWMTISAITDEMGQVTHFIGISSDITSLKQHEKHLEQVAHYDTLTGIPNRLLLNDRMRQAVARAAREQNMMAVCYLDLDGFKPINDTMGHKVGDDVLIEIAHRIQNTLRGEDTVARLGGDEFVILLPGQHCGEESSIQLERLLVAISEPFHIMDRIFKLSASIGVSFYPLHANDPDSLLRYADQAMYIAKKAGKSQFQVYNPAL